MIKLLSSPEIYSDAETMLRSNRANITKAADERVEAELNYEGESYPLGNSQK
jgi:non-specific serine/threonine protein kinase